MDKPADANTVQAKIFWTTDDRGKNYDKQFKNLIGWYVDASESEPLFDSLKGIQGKKVLDVGCGTGRHLSRLPADNELFGIDLSESMLMEARAKNTAGSFEVASAEKLPFQENSFDVVFSSRVIQHMRDQQKMIDEMSRVCKPGGKVILICYNSWSFLNVYKHIRMSWVGKVLNFPIGWLLKQRSFFGPWGFEYDNYCSTPEVKKMMLKSNIKPQQSWGVSSAMPWFLVNFFIAKILELIAPWLLKAILKFYLWIDRTLARFFPLKYITDLILVVGIKSS
jgi:ubiquinone/menaquinone biosynthesis C-methylase UbiE